MAGTIQSVDSVPAFESKEQADAWLEEWEKQYAKNNPFTTKTDGFQRQTTLAEWRAEVNALALRNTMKGKGNATTSTQTPLEAARNGATDVSQSAGNSLATTSANAAGGSAGAGAGNGTGGNGGGLAADRGGATYISNITIPGLADREVIRFADPISQARNEDLLRKLAQAKSTAIR